MLLGVGYEIKIAVPRVLPTAWGGLAYGVKIAVPRVLSTACHPCHLLSAVARFLRRQPISPYHALSNTRGTAILNS